MEHWVIDWAKVTTIDHIKQILICTNLQPIPENHSFFMIQDLCKLIDDDGKRIIDTKANDNQPNN